MINNNSRVNPNSVSISPKKLRNSKWTAVSPSNKEKHFLVTKVSYDEEGIVTLCRLQAVMTKQSYDIDWREFNNRAKWLFGWQ